MLEVLPNGIKGTIAPKQIVRIRLHHIRHVFVGLSAELLKSNEISSEPLNEEARIRKLSLQKY